MKRKKKPTAPPSPAGTIVTGCCIQMGPAKVDPPSEASVVAIARAAERLAEALNTLARSAGGPPITIGGTGIRIGGPDA